MGVRFISVQMHPVPMAYEFTYQTFDGLRGASGDAFNGILDDLIPRGEEIIAAYRSGRGGAVFTARRAIAIDAKGITGKQKVVTVVPYSKVSAYAFEGASIRSFDGRLTLWNRGIGTITFAFEDRTDLGRIAAALADGS